MALEGAKVLIIEDDIYISRMYQLKLSLDGIKVELADNGKAGLEKVEDFRPDVILLDILMPEMDGFEVLKSLKSDPKNQDIPVLIMSNYGQEEDIKKGLELGAVGYLVKSQYTPSTVVDKIRSIIEGTYVQEKAE